MKVSLVGAGPGDPGLLTLRGRELLAQADTVVYDALANPDLLALAPPQAELIYVGKIADHHALPQTEINALLAQKARSGKKVVRLKGGDPYIFGRGGEEAEYLHDHGIDFEEVPGISSAIAAPAYAGIPLTHRDFTSSVTIVTGHEKPDKPGSCLNWQALAQSGSTLVFVMGVKNLEDIARNLIDARMAPDTPAAIIYRGTTPMQRSLVATLEDLPAKAAANNFTNPSVVVVGKVAELHDKLDWFSAKPLLGRSIVVTRAREQASDLAHGLAALGAHVIQCPTIEIFPLEDYAQADEAITNLDNYDWLVFTSVNGVDHFWQRLAAAGKDSRALKGLVAAIGPATASALSSKGINADLVPKTYVAEEVARAMIDRGSLLGKRVLIPRASSARMVLRDDLVAAGALVDIVPVYVTRPGTGNIAEVNRLLEQNALDCVTFGSSSTARNFFNLLSPQILLQHPETHLAAIGPVTAETLREYGLSAAIEPKKYTIRGLIEAVCAYFAHKPKENRP